MKPYYLAISFLLAVFAFSASCKPVSAASSIYISIRSDGKSGSGTANDPYDGSTAARFDSALAAISYPATVILGPGTFLTQAPVSIPSGELTGAGMTATTIKLADGAVGPDTQVTVVTVGGNLHDLTIDANIPNAKGADNTINAFSVEGKDATATRLCVKNYGSTDEVGPLTIISNATGSSQSAVPMLAASFSAISSSVPAPVIPAPSSAPAPVTTTTTSTSSTGTTSSLAPASSSTPVAAAPGSFSAPLTVVMNDSSSVTSPAVTTGEVLVPESAGIAPTDPGVRYHTQLRVLNLPNASSSGTTSSGTSQYNTPATIRATYNLPSTGGSGAIAIVDSYHYPTALADFNTFSSTFGLPQETSSNVMGSSNHVFQEVYAAGYKPQSGGNYIASWNLEAALDIEWAHAMAPNAKIYLVEAASDSTNDLDNAVRVAATLPGVKEISMSWGGSEVSYEAMAFDSIFTASGIVYFASGGDTGAVMEYPAASPNVVSCGGTTINRSSTGAFLSETAWSNTGCGASAYESRPAFQNGISSIVGSKRGVSDMSFVADANTGVYVYDSTPLWGESGWWILGGTSVSSPSLAGVVNTAATAGNGFAASTADEQARIYGHLGQASVFRDITSGSAGKFSAKAGWDYVTGAGTPLGLVGK